MKTLYTLTIILATAAAALSAALGYDYCTIGRGLHPALAALAFIGFAIVAVFAATRFAEIAENERFNKRHGFRV